MPHKKNRQKKERAPNVKVVAKTPAVVVVMPSNFDKYKNVASQESKEVTTLQTVLDDLKLLDTLTLSSEEKKAIQADITLFISTNRFEIMRDLEIVSSRITLEQTKPEEERLLATCRLHLELLQNKLAEANRLHPEIFLGLNKEIENRIRDVNETLSKGKIGQHEVVHELDDKHVDSKKLEEEKKEEVGMQENKPLPFVKQPVAKEEKDILRPVVIKIAELAKDYITSIHDKQGIKVTDYPVEEELFHASLEAVETLLPLTDKNIDVVKQKIMAIYNKSTIGTIYNIDQIDALKIAYFLNIYQTTEKYLYGNADATTKSRLWKILKPKILNAAIDLNKNDSTYTKGYLGGAPNRYSDSMVAILITAYDELEPSKLRDFKDPLEKLFRNREVTAYAMINKLSKDLKEVPEKSLKNIVQLAKTALQEIKVDAKEEPDETKRKKQEAELKYQAKIADELITKTLYCLADFNSLPYSEIIKIINNQLDDKNIFTEVTDKEKIKKLLINRLNDIYKPKILETQKFDRLRDLEKELKNAENLESKKSILNKIERILKNWEAFKKTIPFEDRQDENVLRIDNAIKPLERPLVNEADELLAKIHDHLKEGEQKPVAEQLSQLSAGNREETEKLLAQLAQIVRILYANNLFDLSVPMLIGNATGHFAFKCDAILHAIALQSDEETRNKFLRLVYKVEIDRDGIKEVSDRCFDTSKDSKDILERTDIVRQEACAQAILEHPLANNLSTEKLCNLAAFLKQEKAIEIITQNTRIATDKKEIVLGMLKKVSEEKIEFHAQKFMDSAEELQKYVTKKLTENVDPTVLRIRLGAKQESLILKELISVLDRIKNHDKEALSLTRSVAQLMTAFLLIKANSTPQAIDQIIKTLDPKTAYEIFEKLPKDLKFSYAKHLFDKLDIDHIDQSIIKKYIEALTEDKTKCAHVFELFCLCDDKNSATRLALAIAISESKNMRDWLITHDMERQSLREFFNRFELSKLSSRDIAKIDKESRIDYLKKLGPWSEAKYSLGGTPFNPSTLKENIKSLTHDFREDDVKRFLVDDEKESLFETAIIVSFSKNIDGIVDFIREDPITPRKKAMAWTLIKELDNGLWKKTDNVKLHEYLNHSKIEKKAARVVTRFINNIIYDMMNFTLGAIGDRQTEASVPVSDGSPRRRLMVAFYAYDKKNDSYDLEMNELVRTEIETNSAYFFQNASISARKIALCNPQTVIDLFRRVELTKVLQDVMKEGLLPSELLEIVNSLEDAPTYMIKEIHEEKGENGEIKQVEKEVPVYPQNAFLYTFRAGLHAFLSQPNLDANSLLKEQEAIMALYKKYSLLDAKCNSYNHHPILAMLQTAYNENQNKPDHARLIENLYHQIINSNDNLLKEFLGKNTGYSPKNSKTKKWVKRIFIGALTGVAIFGFGKLAGLLFPGFSSSVSGFLGPITGAVTTVGTSIALTLAGVSVWPIVLIVGAIVIAGVGAAIYAAVKPKKEKEKGLIRQGVDKVVGAVNKVSEAVQDVISNQRTTNILEFSVLEKLLIDLDSNRMALRKLLADETARTNLAKTILFYKDNGRDITNCPTISEDMKDLTRQLSDVCYYKKSFIWKWTVNVSAVLLNTVTALLNIITTLLIVRLIFPRLTIPAVPVPSLTEWRLNKKCEAAKKLIKMDESLVQDRAEPVSQDEKFGRAQTTHVEVKIALIDAKQEVKSTPTPTPPIEFTVHRAALTTPGTQRLSAMPASPVARPTTGPLHRRPSVESHGSHHEEKKRHAPSAKSNPGGGTGKAS